MKRTVYSQDHEAYRQMLRKFIENEIVPVYDDWLTDGHPPREFYRRLARSESLASISPRSTEVRESPASNIPPSPPRRSPGQGCPSGTRRCTPTW